MLMLKVRGVLAWEFAGLADCFAIHVRCEAAHVTLSGNVKNQYRRCRAEEATRRVRGVLGVTNRLRVRRPLRVERRTHVVIGPWPVPAYSEVTIEEPPEQDRATSEAVLRSLRREGVPTGDDAVRVCAVGKTVYLLGHVGDEATAELAVSVALAQPQVDRVRNKLGGACGNQDAATPEEAARLSTGGMRG
jgi:osmotically-inducible protein OsmY